MNKDYTKLIPMLPPRPEKAIPRDMIKLYEKLGWTAQFKKNGTYAVVYVSPEKKVSSLNRVMAPHKAWDFTEVSRKPFEQLPGDGWYVVCCELMHSKVPGIRDTLYAHDILVANGHRLTDKTFAQRHRLLTDMFLDKPITSTRSHWVLPNNLWLAKNHKGDFTALYDSITDPADEGLVLKNPESFLTQDSARWSVKSRYPHKNFSF